MPEVKDSRWLVTGICILLAAIVWVVFGQTLHHGFVNYDDNLYVYENSAVTRGLDLKGVEWAFTHRVCANWHPLTMMSHMLDCQLYGLNPGGHHLTNVLLHTASVILLFLVLRRMTGFLWRSAFVAAVFAIHPLRVESVAWVSERKDVLSGLFFMLTLWAYARYVASGKWQVTGADSTPSPATRHPSLFYWLVLGFFALGLMSKPMLVTLPFVLLLLDYWPLGRLSGVKCQVSGPDSRFPFPVSRFPPQISRLFLEKLPLFGLAVASCVVTIFAQHEAIQASDKFSLPLRAGNASITYVAYLDQMFRPSGLAVLYPFPAAGIEVSEVVLSLVLLAGITTGAFVLHRRRPYLFTGWLWYLIMLTPVIGILQVGLQARADRYTYLPQIGLYLMLTWAAAELSAGWRQRRVVLGGGATVILVALILCARGQTSHWRNGELLWTHTLDCTSGNYVAHNNLGNVLLKKGQVDEAMVQYQKSLGIKSDYAEACYNLGGALLQKGHVDEAIVQCQRALEIRPDYVEARNNLGYALLLKGQADEAIAQFQRALEIKPDYVEVHNNLGNVLLHQGRVDEAIAQYQTALEIKPDYADAHNDLGMALLQKGNVDEAMVHFQKALQISPDDAKAHNNLGNVLLRKGQVDEAITHFQKALAIKPDSLEGHVNLGSALLQQGSVNEAIAQYQQALQINPDSTAVRHNLDAALRQKSRVDNALAQYQQVLQIKPDSVEALNNLAWLLATCPDAHVRDGVQAVKYGERACELTHYGVTVLVGTLAAAYAEAGRFDDAMATAQKACALASAAGEQDLLEKNQKLLELYRAHQPYHEAAAKVVPAAPQL